MQRITHTMLYTREMAIESLGTNGVPYLIKQLAIILARLQTAVATCVNMCHIEYRHSAFNVIYYFEDFL